MIADVQHTIVPKRIRLAWIASCAHACRTRVGSGDHVLGWLDQAVVSAANFAAIVTIAHYANSTQLGQYAIAISVLALLIAAQESLITRPYSIQLHRPVGSTKNHASCSLILSFLLSTICSVLLWITALFFNAVSVDHVLVEMSCVIAAITPFVLFREFARRFTFAHLKFGNALRLDMAVAFLNLAALAYLAWARELSAISACVALGMSSGVSVITWLGLSRNEFGTSIEELRLAAKQSCALGRWLLVSQLSGQVQGYTIQWVITIVGGAAMTGAYAAANSIVAFTNPLLFGFYNVFGPTSVAALQSGGSAKLKQKAAEASLLLTSVMIVLALVFVVAGSKLLQWLYPGAEYEAGAQVIGLLGLWVAATALGTPAAIALGTAECGQALAMLSIGAAILNAACVLICMVEWGVVGAVYGMLTTALIGSLVRWLALLWLLPTDGPSLARSHPSTEIAQ